MFAVGHFALGYLTGKGLAKLLGVSINIPLMFLASILADIDILIPGLKHRGPLHSILLFCLVFIPIFAHYKKRALPYFGAAIQHIVVGDFIVGRDLQLLWPLDLSGYGFEFAMGSLLDVTLEWLLFLISMGVMISEKDIFSLFKPNSSNMILTIPLLSVLLPTLISYPIYVPFSFFIHLPQSRDARFYLKPR